MEWMLMPLKRYAEFSGRSRRMEYWMWVVFQFLIGIAFWIIMAAVGGAALMSGDVTALAGAGGLLLIIYLLYMLLMLAFLIPGLAVAVRRLHDTERSGWWILAPMVPYLVAWFAIFSAASAGGGGGTIGVIGIVCMLAALGLGIMLLVFMFLDGTPGPNKYGPDPKGRGGDARVFT